MYFLQVIIVKIFYSFSERIKNSRPSPLLYLIITERAEYQKIVYYINKKPGRLLNNR
jgi:hypothetical protein